MLREGQGILLQEPLAAQLINAGLSALTALLHPISHSIANRVAELPLGDSLNRYLRKCRLLRCPAGSSRADFSMEWKSRESAQLRLHNPEFIFAAEAFPEGILKSLHAVL